LLCSGIVTDLINVLPGNSSVNTAQHAAVEETVFSVSAVTSRIGGWWLCPVMISILAVSQKNMVMSPVGLKPRMTAGKGQQQITRPDQQSW
jgi:hypothetical protein